MSEPGDDRIRSAVLELVEASPPPYPYSRVATQPRPAGRWTGLKSGPVVMMVAAAVVLFVGLIGVWVGSEALPGDPLEPGPASPPTTAANLPEGATVVPNSHLAARLLSEGAGYDEFAAAAFLCTRGGSGAGPHAFCIVDDQDLMVVVPLRMPAGVDASIEGSAFQQPVVIPLPAVVSEDALPALEDLWAVAHEDGTVNVELRYIGEPAGAGLSGTFRSEEDAEASGEHGPEPGGPEVNIAEGTYQGSDIAWQLSAFTTTDGNICIRLRGMSCVAPPGQTQRLTALSSTASVGEGEADRWCAFGPVSNAASVELNPGSIPAPIYTNDAFDFDFFAHCAIGSSPPSSASALDEEGDVLETTGT